MRVAFLFLFLAAFPLHAAELELGIRHVAHWPMGNGAFEGGDVEIVTSRGFAATAEVFWTPRISTQLAGTFVNPAAFLHPAEVDLGTFGMDTYSLSARYHFTPSAKLCPFAGAGAAMVIFGDLEDRFGDDLEMTFDRESAFLVEGGLRYRVFDHVIVDAALSYMPLEAKRNHVRNDTALALPTIIAVDPLTLSVGAAWRF
ncbi:MAG TPA: OmpW family outer membrane protein [Thermoanaerobaculia bacterium]|nr:OmpW family outer membrane protein [Thermoanaerobaculia bacterium]